MRLVDQYVALRSELPADWASARLSVTPEEPGSLPRVLAILSPTSPGKVGDSAHFELRVSGGAAGPEGVKRLLGAVDAERIWATLRLEHCEERERRPEPHRVPALVEAFESALAPLPDDWSDLLCEVSVTSTDYLDRGALLFSALNPARSADDRHSFTFRLARVAGYGASPTMARRCFERCDAEGITGSVRVLRVLSSTHLVGTQGPSWIVGGKTL